MELNLSNRLQSAKVWIEANPRLFVAGMAVGLVATAALVACATLFSADFTHFVKANPLLFSASVLGGATLALLDAKKTKLVAMTLLACLGVGASLWYGAPSFGGYTAAFVAGFAFTYLIKHIKQQTNPVEDVDTIKNITFKDVSAAAPPWDANYTMDIPCEGDAE